MHRASKPPPPGSAFASTERTFNEKTTNRDGRANWPASPGGCARPTAPSAQILPHPPITPDRAAPSLNRTVTPPKDGLNVSSSNAGSIGSRDVTDSRWNHRDTHPKVPSTANHEPKKSANGENHDRQLAMLRWMPTTLTPRTTGGIGARRKQLTAHPRCARSGWRPRSRAVNQRNFATTVYASEIDRPQASRRSHRPAAG